MRTFILVALIITISGPLLRAGDLQVSSAAITLTECFAIAEKNYEPLKIAKQEIDVSGQKLAESTRNLFPNLTAKAEKTNGDAIRETGSPAFREESYGVQVTYPLFQGGRIWATHKQAKSNYEISKLKYDKTRQDMVYGVNEAFWNLVKANSNAAEYEKALNDVKKIYDMTKELFKTGGINEKELLQVESQYNQAVYQLETTRYDLENYKWKLADALGLGKPLENMPGCGVPYRQIDINIEECQKTAESAHCDILMQKGVVKSSRYGLKARKSYKWPKLDVNGFYGKSGGAYESEELKLTEDFQIGVQLTETFWLNTFAASGTKQKTSPKLGQSSRTESDTVSASLSVLDSYKQKSDEKEAALDYGRSLLDLQKTQMGVNSGVRDAYFNYRKALSQVGNSEIELNIATKELAINKINLGNDKASVANVAEARNKCASSSAALNDAKVFYLISIAALNRAVGVEDRYSVK